MIEEEEEQAIFRFRLRNQITSKKAFSLLHIIRHASKELYFDEFKFSGNLDLNENIDIAKCLPFNSALTAAATVFDSRQMSNTRLTSSCHTPWINAKMDSYDAQRRCTPSIVQAFNQWVHADSVVIGCRIPEYIYLKFLVGYEEHGRKKAKICSHFSTQGMTRRLKIILEVCRRRNNNPLILLKVPIQHLFDHLPNFQCIVPTIILVAPSGWTDWEKLYPKEKATSIRHETSRKVRTENEIEYTFHLPLLLPNDTQPLPREAIEVKIRYGLVETYLIRKYIKRMCEVTIRPSVRPKTTAQ